MAIMPAITKEGKMTEKQIKEQLISFTFDYTMANRLSCARPEADEPGTYLEQSDCRDDFIADLLCIIQEIIKK